MWQKKVKNWTGSHAGDGYWMCGKFMGATGRLYGYHRITDPCLYCSPKFWPIHFYWHVILVLTQFLKLMAEQKIYCGICKQRISTDKFWSHVSREHVDYLPYTCSTCSTKFVSVAELTLHEDDFPGHFGDYVIFYVILFVKYFYIWKFKRKFHKYFNKFKRNRFWWRNLNFISEQI